jgi:hypothetical protein
VLVIDPHAQGCGIASFAVLLNRLSNMRRASFIECNQAGAILLGDPSGETSKSSHVTVPSSRPKRKDMHEVLAASSA